MVPRVSLPEPDTFEAVLMNYDTYFQPRKNLANLRVQFDKRVQETEATVEQYVRSLHVLAGDCEVAGLEEGIGDRFVVGLKEEDVSDKLHLEAAVDPPSLVAKESQQAYKLAAHCTPL